MKSFIERINQLKPSFRDALNALIEERESLINEEASLNEVNYAASIIRKIRIINENSKEVCKIKVDDCLIRDGERCDFLILACQDKLAFFVEFKGHDLGKALTQINSSINILKDQIHDFKFYARVVLNRTPSPNINSSIDIKLKKRLKQKNGDESRELVNYKSQFLEERV